MDNSIDSCILTLQWFIDNILKIGDKFSLITFSDDATKIISLKEIINNNDKEIIKSKIKNIKCDGCTNLSSGLNLAIHELTKSEMKNNVLILLSDGIPNRGVQNHDQIKNIANNILKKNFPKENNIQVLTFGYTDNHDSDLLKDLSAINKEEGDIEYKKGYYSFIPNDSKETIAKVFGDTLSGLKTVIAQNIKGTITFDKNIIQIKNIWSI